MEPGGGWSLLQITSGRMRENSLKLHQGRFRLDIWRNLFTERVEKQCSRLPREHGGDAGFMVGLINLKGLFQA